MLKITIPLNSVTKKNHSQVVMIKGRPIVLPSKPYQAYEKGCKQYMPILEKPIDYPINLKVTYYMQTRRKIDLSNLLASTSDILTHYKVIDDDNRNVIAGYDGSRVYYDKENPRCIIEIEKVENYDQW